MQLQSIGCLDREGHLHFSPFSFLSWTLHLLPQHVHQGLILSFYSSYIRLLALNFSIKALLSTLKLYISPPESYSLRFISLRTSEMFSGSLRMLVKHSCVISPCEALCIPEVESAVKYWRSELLIAGLSFEAKSFCGPERINYVPSSIGDLPTLPLPF